MGGSGHHEREYEKTYRELARKRRKIEKYVGRILMALLVIAILFSGF
ncbi:hypothetical protein PM10SUCC1_16550 [Propionigenium maris DSM 9537]|uniref:Uncharacterized protein n=1 Tax=Propionigenium maris DSM 9537 TaxID=1123000 RepID=A0A9W6GLR4_9FUSO|nr:hypothetical protein [Propionigenium maris]GLI56141.1 hypothetical protein PM10SUCC1_16550 [Propionigenium maris DSM 9537]